MATTQDLTTATALGAVYQANMSRGVNSTQTCGLNLTGAQINALFQKIIRDKQFDEVTQGLLIALFVTLSLIGVIGNGMVCAAVLRNRQMRTPRNLFIVNLAVSDMTLCLLTQPLNLLQLCMYPKWNFGDAMCHIVPMLPATNVFVSTMSITAIALDRLQVIAYPTTDIAKRVGAVTALLCIWSISILMASPVLVFNGVKDIGACGLTFYRACMENPEMWEFKSAYAVFSIIFQYVVPFCLVVGAHAQICSKMRARIVNHPPPAQPKLRLQPTSSNGGESPLPGRGGASKVGGASTNIVTSRADERERRARKTNKLLIAIACVFAISWLPLNIYNLVMDFDPSLFSVIDGRRLLVTSCNLFVLFSACANPILYGWLNDNFHREFVAMLHAIRALLCCKPVVAGNVPTGNSHFRAMGTTIERAPLNATVV